MRDVKSHDPESTRWRNRLNEVHGILLAVHKAVLDHERSRYEKLHGPVATAGEVLRLVIGDPFFQWLRPLTVLITQIDEVTEAGGPLDVSAATALLDQAESMLTPDEAGDPFQREYARALQDSPNVSEAHGHWKFLAKSFHDTK